MPPTIPLTCASPVYVCSASPSFSGSPSCPAFSAVVTLTISGGVTASSALSAPVGVLARLALACYLGIPLASVTLDGASSAGGDALALPQDNLANTMNGSCSDAGLPVLRVLRSDSEKVEDSVLRRSAAASQPNATQAAIVVVLRAALGGCAGGAMFRVSGLVNSTGTAGSSGSNASAALAQGLPLGAFLAAAAGASGVSSSAVSAVVTSSTVAAAAPVGSGSSSAPGASMPTSGAIAGGVIGAVVAVAVLAAGAVYIARRQRASPLRLVHLPPPGEDSLVEFDGVNPIHRAKADANGTSTK